MTTSNRFAVKSCQVAVSGLLALTLVACGDSDLQQIHDDGIQAAVDEANEAEAPSEATRSAIDVDEFELVFNDEFNGDELDASLWNSAMAWGPDLVINDEQQFYVDITGHHR